MLLNELNARKSVVYVTKLLSLLVWEIGIGCERSAACHGAKNVDIELFATIQIGTREDQGTTVQISSSVVVDVCYHRHENCCLDRGTKKSTFLVSNNRKQLDNLYHSMPRNGGIDCVVWCWVCG